MKFISLIFLSLISVSTLSPLPLHLSSFVHTHTYNLSEYDQKSIRLFLVKLIKALVGNSEFMSLDLHEKASVILSIRLYVESYVNKLSNTRQPQQSKRFRWQTNRFHSKRSV